MVSGYGLVAGWCQFVWCVGKLMVGGDGVCLFVASMWWMVGGDGW